MAAAKKVHGQEGTCEEGSRRRRHLPKKKAAAKKAPAKKKAAAKKAPAKKKAAAKKAPAKKRAAAKKAPAKKKAAAKKAPAKKKAAAKKAPAKKAAGQQALITRRPRTSRGRGHAPPVARPCQPIAIERADQRSVRSVINLKTSAAATLCGRPSSREAVAHASRNAAAAPRRRLHRRLELALVRLERGELGLDVALTSSTWSGASASNSSSGRGRWAASPCSGKKCGSRAATMRVACQQPGVAMVGVEPVALPRIVAEHDVGSQLADARARPRRGRADRCRARRRRSRGSAPRQRRAPASRRAASRCSSWRRGHERDRVGARVPRPLRAVGAHEVVDRAAGRGPLRQRRAAAELDVVGMGADRQRRARAPSRSRVHVVRRPPAAGPVRCWSSSAAAQQFSDRHVIAPAERSGRAGGSAGGSDRRPCRGRARARCRAAPSPGGRSPWPARDGGGTSRDRTRRGSSIATGGRSRSSRRGVGRGR